MKFSDPSFKPFSFKDKKEKVDKVKLMTMVDVFQLIVDKVSILNTLWTKQLSTGKWNSYNLNKNTVRKELQNIIKDKKVFDNMPYGLQSKFKNMLFSTIEFLYKQYGIWANENARTKTIKPEQLKHIVNNQGKIAKEKDTKNIQKE